MIKNEFLATDASIKLAVEMRKVMKEKRLSYIDDRTGKPISLRSLASKGNMDVAILHRAENPDIDTLPSIAFWFDWILSMADSGLTLQNVMDEAQERLKRSRD